MDYQDKLLVAYNQVMDHVAEAIHHADSALQPTIEEMINNATHLVQQAQDINLKESQEFTHYLKRDLDDALHSLQQQGKEMSDWLKFDYELVEDKFIDIVSNAADKTWLTLNHLENSKRVVTLYKTGEITSPGVLNCVTCDQTMQFHKSTHIPPCPKCHKTEFIRKPL